MDYFKQCYMTKGPAYQVALIPEKFAVVGRLVRLEEDGGWLVTSAGRRVSKEFLDLKQRADRHQREASDI